MSLYPAPQTIPTIRNAQRLWWDITPTHEAWATCLPDDFGDLFPIDYKAFHYHATSNPH